VSTVSRPDGHTKPTPAEAPGRLLSGARSVPDLLGLTAEIIDIPSVSHHESELADSVEADLERADWLSVDRIGDTVVARTELDRPARLVIAGHLDTVPGGHQPAKIEGHEVWGLGAADMKGGIAVMLALAVTIADPALDVTYVFYPCEEVGNQYNGLRILAAERPDLLTADAAVLGEPTSGLVEGGCQGTLQALLHVRGSRAHTARPFTGVNAIHRCARLLERLSSYEPRRVVLDGCQYAEQLQAVAITGGIASNVVPDDVIVKVNFRFAPDREAGEAVVEVERLLGVALDPDSGDTLEVLEVAPGAPPSLQEPILARLVAASGGRPRAKVGWTDVATFFASGVAAANFGPGDPFLAHTANEHVSRAELEHAYDVLAALISEPG
jgi:succinyl-diaminopimelate desuccinylase